MGRLVLPSGLVLFLAGKSQIQILGVVEVLEYLLVNLIDRNYV